MQYELDDKLQPITRWDGKTYKQHPVTGEQVPDESARMPIKKYINARKAEWPQADYVVGNPPFIGASRMINSLGQGYVEALRNTWKDVPESADLVMFWWHHAAELLGAGQLQRFGFITTNSLRQTFNRRVLESHLNSKQPLSLVFAIPDHPWVDSADGAAVRIAMTVAESGQKIGVLCAVESEKDVGQDEPELVIAKRIGKLHADLRVGANVAAAVPLLANSGISSPGFKLHGAGFIVSRDVADKLGLGRVQGLESRIKEYRNGRDLTERPRDVLVIDLYGQSQEEVRSLFPAVYQHVLENVKPERDQNNRATYRDNWWIFGEPRKDLRPMLAGLSRYVATVETTKHRIFQFLDQKIAPDNMLTCIAVGDSLHLGILSSQLDVIWSLAAGGRLGVGNDPRYNKTRCFEPFPFPVVDDDLANRVRKLAEQLDTHRKSQQQQHPDLTLTGMYNVLEKLKSGEALNAKDKVIHEQGLVSVLKQLHDELDLAVLDAYGWSDLAPLLQIVNGNAASGDKSREHSKRELDEILLERLVALNSERAAEEQRGLIRWLRPEYQNPQGAGHSAQTTSTQAELEVDSTEETPILVVAEKLPWPKGDIEQVKAVAAVLAASKAPLTVDAIADHFTSRGQWRKRLPAILDMLVAVGRARVTEQQAYIAF